MSTENIQEAEVVEEGKAAVNVLTVFTPEDKPQLPEILDKESALLIIQTEFDKHNVDIKDTKDTANYKKVVAGLKVLRDSRLAWDKSIEQNVYKPAKEWFEALGADYDAIVAEFKAKELLLKTKKEAIDAQKKKEKEDEENKKTLELGNRIEKIVSLGGKSDGKKYVFDYDLTLFSDIGLLKEMSADDWDKHIAEIQAAFDVEKKRLADAKKDSDALLLANQNQATELNLKRTRLRRKELQLEGFIGTPENGYMNESFFTVSEQQLLELEDDAWDALILSASEEPAAEVKTTPVVAKVEVKSTGGGAIGWGGSPAPVEIPKVSEVAPVNVAEDDDEQFPWLAGLDEDKPAEVVQPEAKASEELGIKQRTLNFSKVNPFIKFKMGDFVIRMFPTEDEDVVYADLKEEGMIAMDGPINETLSFVLISE